jgi:SAM-dependent methyltransferase
MYAELPGAWGQQAPRAVRLAPDGPLVPAATLGVLLRGGRRLQLIQVGHTLEPWLRNEQVFWVEAGPRPLQPGDLALCAVDGWGEVRRILQSGGTGPSSTGLDTLPGHRGPLPAADLLGRVEGVPLAGGLTGRWMARCFPLGARLAALYEGGRRIACAPDFGATADASVRNKYGQQVQGYVAMSALPMRREAEDVLLRRAPAGGSILVAGCGAGGEALHLARAGYRVTGFDVVPAMIEAARALARETGVEVEFLQADLVSLDLGLRRFAAIYFTPLLYSFLAGHHRRRAALARAGRHLEPGGIVLFTAYRMRTPGEWVEQALAWTVRRARGGRCEFGDWYTSFLTPQGRLGHSYIHRGSGAKARRAAQEAGFGRVVHAGAAHYIAERFVPA